MLLLDITHSHSLTLAIFSGLSGRRDLVVLHLADEAIVHNLVQPDAGRIWNLGTELSSFGVLFVLVAEGGLSLFV